MSRWEKSDAPKRKDAKKETTSVDVVSFFYLFPEAEVLLDGVWSFAASASLVAGSLEEGRVDEDGVELSSDEEEGTVVDDAGSLVSAVVLSVEDSAVDSL